MDFMVHRVRVSAYERIVTDYRLTVSVQFDVSALEMESIDQTKQFPRKRRAVISAMNDVDCKTSHTALPC